VLRLIFSFLNIIVDIQVNNLFSKQLRSVKELVELETEICDDGMIIYSGRGRRQEICYSSLHVFHMNEASNENQKAHFLLNRRISLSAWGQKLAHFLTTKPDKKFVSPMGV